MHRVRMLRHYGITPYIVFDGGPLPAKQGTEESRAAKRTENLARGKALAAQGRHSQAREFFCKCVDVTPQMAFQLIKVRFIFVNSSLQSLKACPPGTPSRERPICGGTL
jgi:exonuclease-1